MKPKIITANSTGWIVPGAEVVNEEHVVARAGMWISCPKCGDRIGRFTQDLYSGARVKADSIEFKPRQKKHPEKPGKQPERHQLAYCNKCDDEPYIKHFYRGPNKPYDTKVHVEGLGWI